MRRWKSFGVVTFLCILTVGCATKNYVRNQTAPTVNKVNELDELTAKNTAAIKDVDARSQQGIQQVNAKASVADQKALAAGQQADQAQTTANHAANGINSLANTVANLDNYKAVADTAVHFGFDKYDLTKDARQSLDDLATRIPSVRGFIVVVDGNTDSVGPASYNYVLSQRRADAVINYLVAKYNVPAHKLFVIGLGKDKPEAANNSAKGRAENRRVDVHLMTNLEGESTSARAEPLPPTR
ncbi:MAG: OmpA family protein [Terriglobales bacterium]|jgi:outer membrane protein OmpA-like peptidoglycan-associated protein